MLTVSVSCLVQAAQTATAGLDSDGTMHHVDSGVPQDQDAQSGSRQLNTTVQSA